MIEKEYGVSQWHPYFFGFFDDCDNFGILSSLSSSSSLSLSLSSSLSSFSFSLKSASPSLSRISCSGINDNDKDCEIWLVIDESGETIRQSSDKLYENASKTLNPDGTSPGSNSSTALNQDVGISKKIFWSFYYGKRLNMIEYIGRWLKTEVSTWSLKNI